MTWGKAETKEIHTMHRSDFAFRRNLVDAAGALLLVGHARPSRAQTRRRATPSQTEGP